MPLTQEERAAKLPPSRENVVPKSVTKAQAKVALLAIGELAVVEALVDEAKGSDPILAIAWADASEWHRDSPMINGLAKVLNMSDKDIDDLFIAASKVKF